MLISRILRSGVWIFWAAMAGCYGADPLNLESISPADGAQGTGTSIGQVVEARFTVALDESSVTGESFLVVDEETATPVPGTRYASGDGLVTFVPLRAWDPGRTYRVELTAEILSKDGMPLEAAAISTFRTAEYDWGGAQTVESDDGVVHGLESLTLADGDTLAIWHYLSLEDGEQLWSRRFDTESGQWESPRRIDNDPSLDDIISGSIEAAASRNGDAFVMWRQEDASGDPRVLVSILDAGTGSWTPPYAVDRATGQAGGDTLAVNDNGDAIAVFTDIDTPAEPESDASVFMNRYSAESRLWEGPREVDDDSSFFATDGSVALDNAGNAVFAYRQADTMGTVVWARYFDGETLTFGNATRLETDNAVSSDPRVVKTDEGEFTVVFTYSGGSKQLAYAEIDATGPQSYELLPTAAFGEIEDFAARANALGDVMIVAEVMGTEREDLISVFRDGIEESWSDITRVEIFDGGRSMRADLALNDAGAAAVVWKYVTATEGSALAARFSPITGEWSSPKATERMSSPVYFTPTVGIREDGTAMAVWAQEDLLRASVWYSHFR